MQGDILLIKPGEADTEAIHAFRQEFIDREETVPGTYGEFMRLDIPQWIAFCKLCEQAETLPTFANRPRFVVHEQFLLVRKSTGKVLGVIMLRHQLDEPLARFGGHIGFSICPSERGKGYAKAMLALCLKKCPARGLDRVLITCNESNEASRRTILACGGMPDGVAIEWDGGRVERYWV
jgi:predicted acetyltransferase